MRPYQEGEQWKNLMWMLPRPKPDHYKGGMPLGAERWLLDLAADLLGHDYVWARDEVLNVFCGMNKEGVRVDINPEVKPDFLGDVQELSNVLPPLMQGRFRVVLADPAYSDQENLELYGHRMHLDYGKWTSECTRFLSPGGLLIVYHKNLMANPDKKRFVVAKRVAIGSRHGHLLRCAVYFRLQGNGS